MPDTHVIAEGPHGAVSVSFDPLGRPTVAGTTWERAAYGLGWCVSRHRRGQMDILRRRSHGRLAEILGPVAVDSDRFQRRLGLADVARRCWAALPPAQGRLLESFAAGVNAGAPPPGDGVPRWTPIDSIAVAQFLFQQLASDGTELRMVEVMRRTLPPEVVDFLLMPDDDYATEVDGSHPGCAPAGVPLDQLRALAAQPPGEQAARLVVTQRQAVGSNAWAVSHGDSAILSNDMHLELTYPSLWYAATLVVPGGWVTGVTIPGLPTVVAGTNASVAWGFTRLPGDAVDLRELTPGGVPDSYLAGERQERFVLRRERIAVRGALDVVVEARDSRWGPVVDELRGRPVVFDSTLTDWRALDFGLVGLYTAGTVAEAVRVLTNSGMPPVNAILADATGSVAWTVAGRFRGRSAPGPRGFSPATPTDPGWIPPDELPRLINPPSGYVVSCNNAHSLARAPGVGWNFFGGCRAHRVSQLLRAGGVDEAGCLRVQADTDARPFAFYRDLALRHLPAGGTRPRLAALREEITAWTGTADRGEYGLALLVIFRDLLREGLFAAVTRPSQRYDPTFTYCYNGHERPLRLLIDALEGGLVPAPWRSGRHFVVGQLLAARALLTRRCGSDRPIRWGEVNRLALSPFDVRVPVEESVAAEVELSGCPECVSVARPDFGASMRLVVDPRHPERGLLSIPGSPSGSPVTNVGHVARWAAGMADPLLAGGIAAIADTTGTGP